MNIFLESVNLDEIRSATSAGLADGIAFSHVALSADAPEADTRDRLDEIAREFAIPICVAVGAVNTDDIYREGRELAKLSDHIVVEVPLVEDALPSMRRLNAEGVTICATFVYSPAQALLAGKAGASMVRIAVDDLEAQGQSGMETVAAIKSVLDAGGQECDVMVASPTTASLFAECALAGADVVCVTPATLRALMVHPLSDRGLDRFLSELSRRPKRPQQ